MHMSAYKGDVNAKKKLNIEMKKIEYLLWVCNTPVFACCPCANTKRGPRPND